jgi:porin
LSIVDNSFPAVNGPKKIRIGRLHYYQDVIAGVLDFKAGYIDNTQEFLGINVVAIWQPETLDRRRRSRSNSV